MPAKNLDDTVREPISENKAQELLDSVNDDQESLSPSWKVRSRRNQERLSSGDPLQLFQVYRGLLELKTAKGSLNNSDRKQLNQSLELLADELAIALGKTSEQAKALLERATSQAVNAA